MVTVGSDNPFPSILLLEHVDPATPPSGHWRLFIDTDNVLKLIDDAGTVTAVGGGGLSDPMTTRGDIIVRDASNVTARLAIGSTGKVLQSNGTDISWQTPAAGGPRIISGRVTSGGSITSGSGYTVTKGGTGIYTINYTVSFTNPPAVYASPSTDNSTFTVMAFPGGVGGTDTAAATQIYIREVSTVTARDKAFSFIAVDIV